MLGAIVSVFYHLYLSLLEALNSLFIWWVGGSTATFSRSWSTTIITTTTWKHI